MGSITEELIAYLKEGKDDIGILSRVSDGEFYHALSKERANVLEWFPFEKNDDVLQAGASYGVFAPLYERVNSWTIADDDEDARECALLVASLRGTGKKLETDSFDGISGRTFDVVIAAGKDADPRALRKFLKPEGTLIVIAGNAAAPRFSLGAEPEPDKNYTTIEALDELRKSFSGGKLYFPLPNADFAKDIRDEAHTPGPGHFRFVSRSARETRFSLCDEEALYDELCAGGKEKFRKYAPDYLAVYTGKAGAAERLPGFIRYNTGRKPQYAVKTVLSDRAYKIALTKEADAHVEGFSERKTIAEGNFRLADVTIGTDPGSGRKTAVFPLLAGENLGAYFAGKITNGKAPEQEIAARLSKITGNEKNLHNLDLIFDNILLTKEGDAVIDYEWVTKEAQDPDFLRYRVLRYWYEDNEKTLTAYRDLRDFLSKFGISERQYLAFGEKEDRFQSGIADEGIRKYETKFLKSAVVPMKEENERLRDEVDELKTVLRKERETERLSQQHIRNIEAINRQREAEIAARDAELSYLRRHQTAASRLKRAFVARLDVWAPAGSRRRMTIKYIKGLICHPGRFLPRFFGREGKLLRRGDFEIGGEFPEGGILTLPGAGMPRVSIVIPAYNQIAYTYACIRSILENTDAGETPYEVILADDASTDVTKEIENFVHGLVHVKTSGNLGFLRNCNHAAKEARGEYIFFLNNDTKVKPGWLSSIIALLDRDHTIGMAGSKLVFADGKLQEAGGIIWSDASGWNYGRGDDPSEPEYNYVKDADYISGAAICIRKSLWQEIGGFDERFAPAYCEDSDLAFAVRKHGKRVVYQPLSEVVHFEGVSNGTDVNGTGLKRYQLVNQEKFKEKWKKELSLQQENTGNPDPFTARDRTKEKKCVLVVDHYVPTWDRDAGSVTTYQYLRMFVKNGWNVKFLGDNFLHEEPYTTTLTQLGVEVLYGERLKSGIWDWIEKNRDHIDVCYLNRPHIAAKYIDFLKDNGIRCIFYGHDLHYLRIRREYELTGEIRKKRESDYWKSLEYEVMEKADKVYYPSADEIREIRLARPDIAEKAKAIVAFLYEEADPREKSGSCEKTPDASCGFLFVGGFKHPPNEDGVLWFAENCWEKIRKECPDAVFRVAGNAPTEAIQGLSEKYPGIRVLGFVTDEELADLYRTSPVVAVPLRYGAGVKGKVTEALSKGCAVVTTPVGAEGIPDAEKAMVIREDAEAFAKACIEVCRNGQRREEMKQAGIRLIREHFSPEAAWKVIEKDFS